MTRTSDSRPVCALCGHAGRGETAEHHMTHGVSVWLCPPHRTPAFLRRRCGRTFTARFEESAAPTAWPPAAGSPPCTPTGAA